LGNRVFTEVFPSLCAALAAGDAEAEKAADGRYSEAYLALLREAALVLLYRLLFLFYAEDRRLLPVMDARYAAYSLSELRDAIAQARDGGKVLSERSSRYWDILNDLFRLIAAGDDAVGMPAYNGGLFEPARVPILARARVADAQLAPVIDALSRRVEDVLKGRINYRDLSVAHLGGLYERLLEYRLEQADGALRVVKAGFARKGSGSYYTHDALVRLVIDESVGRLTQERQQAFDRLLAGYARRHDLKPYEWDALAEADPASQFLALKICDPAMGSGHFLVALVDWLADRILEAAQDSAEKVNNCGFAAHLVEAGRPWTSPIVARVADIRRRILKAAREHGWAVDERQLDDRHIVRRMILKRAVFGVDKNVMAVELAKVALWLHTFTVGAPLSFLDHHLRCGDSLFGGRVRQVRDELAKLAGGLLQRDDLRRVDAARMTMDSIGNLTDIDIAEAHHSKALMEQIEDGLRPLWHLLDFLQARRWAGRAEASDYRQAWADLVSGEFGENLLESMDLLGKPTIKLFNERQRLSHAVVQRALKRAAEEHFLHWELAFPTVWKEGQGGFDVVIGNPPWDRIKLQEVEWFAERRPEIARQARAADRKTLIGKEKEGDTPLWREYLAASEAAETAAAVARSCGDYFLLSGGDINLYSLFVERAQELVRPEGIVGLLTPSGIAADKGASAFFRTLTAPEEPVAPASLPASLNSRLEAGATSAAARLAALYDFENRKVFFPDIHASFKFCALIFGGPARRFAQSRCAFYLHDVAELTDSEHTLTLTGEDFALVNPNTCAAPIFRTRRDAEITMRIYRNHPVLVNRSGGSEQRAWPVRYVTMFHMTNDSGLFLTRAELEKRGFTATALNRWVRSSPLPQAGEGPGVRAVDEAVPLYEGKMVQMYDHRAADVVVNAANLHRAAQQEAIQEAVKEQLDRYPTPQYWVSKEEVAKVHSGEWALGFKEITAPTNVRTMIAAAMPGVGFGNKVPVLLPLDPTDPLNAMRVVLLLANLNSFAFDFVLRQKIQGQTINLFILEQLPVIAPAAYEQTLVGVKLADFIRTEVLALSYTAHDLAPFARDLGYVDADGHVKPPLQWNLEDRAQRMAHLDALFFHLYGLDANDAEYILSTFPIVREQDMKVHGCFRTRDLILDTLAQITTDKFNPADPARSA